MKLIRLREIDLIVLPEMFATGYNVDARAVAGCAGEALDFLRKLARQYSSAVVGTVAVEEHGRYYNRMYFVRPDGTFDKYDKRHLFSFAGEHHSYTAGRERVVVEWRGWRILLQVCYDLRFPVFSRNRGDYDMIVYSADWPASRIEAWDILLRARAVENLCYVVGVNPIHSRLIDFKGRDVGAVDMQSLKYFRAPCKISRFGRFRPFRVTILVSRTLY